MAVFEAWQSPITRHCGEGLGTLASEHDHVHEALCLGSVLMACVYIFGNVSGAHLNPAMTLAVKLRGQTFTWFEATTYMIAQVVGALLAATIHHYTFGGVYGFQPHTNASVLGVSMVEFVFTFLWVFTYLNVTNKSDNEFYGFAIGLSVVGGIVASTWVSGGLLNPAASLSLVMSSHVADVWFFSHVAAQFLAGACASFTFSVLRRESVWFASWREEPVVAEGSRPGQLQNPVLSGFFNMTPRYTSGTEDTLLTERLFSELLGTFVIVFTIGLCLVSPHTVGVQIGLAGVVIALMYSLGDLSGGHFNPSITLAVALSGRGKIGLRDSLFYVLMQLLGGICGACAYTLIAGESVALVPLHFYHDYWRNVGRSFFVQMLFTMLLCFVFLQVVKSKQLATISSLAVGFCYIAGHVSKNSNLGLFTGYLNPAASLSLDAVHRSISSGNGAFLAGSQVLGSILSAMLFRLTNITEKVVIGSA